MRITFLLLLGLGAVAACGSSSSNDATLGTQPSTPVPDADGGGVPPSTGGQDGGPSATDAGPTKPAGGAGCAGLQAGSPWPMPGRCPLRQGRSDFAGPTSDSLAWSKDLDLGGTGSAVIAADGTIYIGSVNPSQLWALDPAAGATKWIYPLADEVVPFDPVIGADGTVYFGADDGAVYAISPAGKLVWRQVLMPDASGVTGDRYATSPAIAADGTLYVSAADKKVYALDPKGTTLWSYDNEFSYTNEPAACAIAPDGSIVYGTNGSADGWAVALKQDGTLKWKFHTGAGNLAAPAIADDGTVYIGSQDDSLYALAPDGTKKWSFAATARIYATPALAADGTVYIGSEDQNLYALNAADGSKKWAFPIDDVDIDTPVAIASDGTIFLGTQKQTLYALTPGGTVKWQHVFSNYRGDHCTPAIGANGELYVTGVIDRNSAIVAFH